MKPTNGTPAASGVQELIDRIRGQGVKAARDEGERIVSQANADAKAILAKAEAQAKAMLDSARATIDIEKTAGAEAIRNAARDALLDLRSQVHQAFEVHVRRLVSQVAQDPGFIRSLVLVLAGEAAERYVTDHDAVIFVSGTLAGGTGVASADEAIKQKIAAAVLGAAGQMLREGVELRGDDRIAGGVKVRLVGQDLEIDMTDESLTRLLLKHLLPRYRAIVQESPAA